MFSPVPSSTRPATVRSTPTARATSSSRTRFVTGASFGTGVRRLGEDSLGLGCDFFRACPLRRLVPFFVARRRLPASGAYRSHIPTACPNSKSVLRKIACVRALPRLAGAIVVAAPISCRWHEHEREHDFSRVPRAMGRAVYQQRRGSPLARAPGHVRGLCRCDQAPKLRHKTLTARDHPSQVHPRC